MTQYAQIFTEAIKLYNFKKVLGELLLVGKVVEPNTVGKIEVNVNNGGVTDIYWTKKPIN